VSFYPDKINEHFLRPRNVGEARRIDAICTVGSLICGAVLRLSLTIDDHSQVITEARFRAAGCGYLIAAASVLTEAIQGLRLGEAVSLPEGLIPDELGNPLAERAHCFTLCREALEGAALDYRSRKLKEWTGEDALICTCFGISESTIERIIAERDLLTVSEVTAACNAGGGCGSCQPLVQEMLDLHATEQAFDAGSLR
jgi:NifU-like protein